jgi:hypothetical protein
MKIIWWYIAGIEEGRGIARSEEQFGAGLFSFQEAVEKATFESDREVLREGIRVFEASYGR